MNPADLRWTNLMNAGRVVLQWLFLCGYFSTVARILDISQDIVTWIIHSLHTTADPAVTVDNL
jgi:hypothetical protein